MINTRHVQLPFHVLLHIIQSAFPPSGSKFHVELTPCLVVLSQQKVNIEQTASWCYTFTLFTPPQVKVCLVEPSAENATEYEWQTITAL